jgi:hypothetical protein
MAWLGGFVAVCGLVGLLIAFFPSPGPDRAAELEPGAPQVYRAPKPIGLGPQARRRLGETIDEFVRTAVLGRDLRRSWELAGPDLRVGTTRAQWLRGELPVYAYPADPKRTEWALEYADEVEVAVNVTLVPRRGVRQPPEVFGVSLEPAGRGPSRRWVVSSWLPRSVVSQPGGEAAQPAATLRPEETAALRRATEGQIDRIWWIVPAALLSLIVLGPLGYFAVRRLFGRPTAPG